MHRDVQRLERPANAWAGQHADVAAAGPAMVWHRFRVGEDGIPFAATVRPAFKANLVPTHESRPNLTHLPAFIFQESDSPPGIPLLCLNIAAREEEDGTSLQSVEASGGRCHLSCMADAAFDTLAVTRQLKAKGFEADQAEAITEAVRTGVTGGVATKADLASLESRLTWRIIIVGLALNAAVIAAIGWMLSGS